MTDSTTVDTDLHPAARGPVRHHAVLARRLDGLAISASALCLIHCLALPFAIAFLPALAAWADGGELFHIVMLAIAVPLSSGTLIA